MVQELTAVIRDYRRDQIVAAARTLLEERGSSDLSLAEVAKQAGVSRSTLYNHFAAREDLLNACLAAARREFVDAARVAASSADDAVGRLAAIFRASLEQIDANPSFFFVTQELLRRGAPTESVAVPEVVMLGIGLTLSLEAILLEGASAGVLAFTDLDAARELVLTALTGAVYRRSFDRAVPASTVATSLVTALVSGLDPRQTS